MIIEVKIEVPDTVGEEFVRRTLETMRDHFVEEFEERNDIVTFEFDIK